MSNNLWGNSEKLRQNLSSTWVEDNNKKLLNKQVKEQQILQKKNQILQEERLKEIDAFIEIIW